MEQHRSKLIERRQYLGNDLADQIGENAKGIRRVQAFKGGMIVAAPWARIDDRYVGEGAPFGPMHPAPQAGVLPAMVGTSVSSAWPRKLMSEIPRKYWA